jgi:hypothetical protein
MSTPTIQPVSFSYESAALATGLSENVIRRAVNAGDLAVRYVQVKGRNISKPVIERAELERWISSGADERVAS